MYVNLCNYVSKQEKAVEINRQKRRDLTDQICCLKRQAIRIARAQAYIIVEWQEQNTSTWAVLHRAVMSVP